MKLYSVTAKEFGWDEYDQFIIWANNSEEALEMVIDCVKGSFREHSNFDIGATVEEVLTPEAPCVLLGSFNAG